MTWRLEIRHETGYRYPRDARASYNEARLTPLSTAGQLTVDARVEVEPRVRLGRYWDYWGTLVHSFDVHVPHRELIVTATSMVETSVADDLDGGDHVDWDGLDEPRVLEELYEFLAPCTMVPVDPGLGEVAASLRAGAATPDEAVAAAAEWVRAALVYEKGSTDVSTSAVEAWRAGRGVCQDFVHVALALLRSMRIPGRYVSGYLHPRADAAFGEAVTGESHAWAEAWTGEWRPFDPTNPGPVGERHVVVARARDYRDVVPLKGIYSGAPSSTFTVNVTLTRRA